MLINKLPAFTFGWLKMNEVDVEVGAVGQTADVACQVPEAFEKAVLPEGILTGSGEGVDAMIEAANVSADVYGVQDGVQIEEPLRVQIDFKDQEQGSVHPYGFVLGKNAAATVVMQYDSEQPADVISAVQTKIRLEEGAKLNLVQVIRGGDDSRLINDIGADLADDAQLHVYHVVLGGKAIYQGCRAELAGKGSELLADVGYIVEKDHILDMNYFANQTGKKTNSVMNVNGVLRDRARKLLRATIDFKYGCAGATGNEQENVLLMDDDIVNQTIPLILCAEEDVEGNHGATIGRIDEDSLFYMRSRGIPEDEVYEVMAKASLDAVIKKIPDEQTIRDIIGEDKE